VNFFDNLPLAGIFLLSVLLFAAASEAGHRFGVIETREANVSTLEASILGLLALMLSFTFAMAVARFDARRDGVLKEANAIGTAALRARLLPAPESGESLQLLRDYVGLRLELLDQADGTGAINASLSRANDDQERLWRVARTAMAKGSGMAPALYVQALNDMFDFQEMRLVAFQHRVPRIVFLTLYAIAAVGLGFSGYASGLEKRRWRVPVYVVNVLVASVILLIQDIDRPDTGAITVDQQPIRDIAASIAAYAPDTEPVPPPAASPARAAPSAARRDPGRQ
jgi:hypothetical protein